MIKKLTPWLAAAAAATLFTAPALADTSADLQKCRSALTEEGHFDTDRQSLKFSYRKGNSHKRTVYMTLRNKQNANRQQVACKLERQHITGLTLIPGT